MYKKTFTLIPCNLLLNLNRYEEPKVKVERKIVAKTSLFQSLKLSKPNNNNKNNNNDNKNNNNRQVYYSEKKNSDMAVAIWKMEKGGKVVRK